MERLGVASRVIVWLHGVWADFTDRGAEPQIQQTKWPDFWKLGLLLVSSGVSLTTEVSRLSQEVLGVSGSAVPLIVLLSGVVWAWFVVRSKSSEPKNIVTAPQPQVVYKSMYTHDQVTRRVAKLGFILLVVLLGQQLWTTIEGLVPLPTTIYGYLVDAKTGGPVEGAVVRVIEKSGRDVTKECLASDSTGLYVVYTLWPVYRTASIVVTQPKCDPAILPLYSLYETEVDALSEAIQINLHPTFRHTIQCSEEP